MKNSPIKTCFGFFFGWGISGGMFLSHGIIWHFFGNAKSSHIKDVS